MRRILFELNGIKIYSYPAMLYLGLNLGMVAENFAAKAAHLDTLSVFIATLLLLIPALVGARLLHVATHWRAHRRAPERIWQQAEGGAAMYAHRFSSAAQCVPNSIWLLLGCGHLTNFGWNDSYENRLSAERLLLGADIEFLVCNVPA